jgi:hypothetical protein
VISGNNIITGTFIDSGLDLIVIRKEQRFFYIPLVHIQSLKEATCLSVEELNMIPEQPIGTDNLSFRKILNHAKGKFVEIYVTGNKSIHGYLTSIMNDYFVFYSPVYKTVYVSMNHLKWLIPYPSEVTPYTISNQSLALNQVSISLSRTFIEQCKKLEGNLVIFDLGEKTEKTGLLHKVDNEIIELIYANGGRVLWNIHHLKTVTLV